MRWRWEETISLKRENLYRDVWSEPAQAVAKRLGISGTALAKICRKLSVPTPPVGYWARKAAGETPVQPVLPRIRPGDPAEHELRRARSPYDESNFAATAVAAIARERTPAAAIVVSERLQAPHRLVAEAAPLLKRATLNARRDVLARLRCLDVVVSLGQMDRALRLMDALIKALESRGHEVEVTEPDPPLPKNPVPPYEMHRYRPSRTGVHIGSAFVEFTLEEVMDVVWPYGKPPPTDDLDAWFKWKGRRTGPDHKHRPSGRLSVKITSATFLDPPRKSWRDGKSQKVETLLNDFVAGLVNVAERHRLWEEFRAQEERERAEVERREQEAARRQQEERRRLRDLKRRVRNWAMAKTIEEVADAMLSRSGKQAADWISWARSQAERLKAEALATPSSGEGERGDEYRET